MIAPLEEALEDSVLLCTFRGFSGGEDGDLAVIELVLSTEASIDASATLMDMAAEAEAGIEPEIDEFTIDLALECEGELLWDPSRGVFSTFELEGEATIDIYLVATVEAGGMGAIEVEGEAEMGLEIAISATAE